MPTAQLSPKSPAESSMTTEGIKVLIVDDDHYIRLALEGTLKGGTFELLLAEGGAEAIKILRETKVGVVICDQKMPSISGVEVLKEALRLQPDAIRILLTGSGDLNTVVEAINIGQASQFILKPWDNASLKQTVTNSVEKYKLVLENQRLHDLIFAQHTALENTHETLRRELRLGARIHEVMLLGHVPEKLPGLSVDATTVPSKDIDGDFFDFYRPLPQLFDVVIGDVMGKGIPAALVGTAVKTQLIRFAIPYNRVQVFDKQGIWRDDVLRPEEILRKVYQEVSKPLIHLEYFVSLFYGRFDLRRSAFSYVDCGSSKPLHYSASNHKIVELKGDNFPIGVLADERLKLYETHFGKDDLFVFYSDGVTEARSPSGELYGSARLRDLVVENHQLSATELLNTIKQSIVTFAQKDTFDDDLTVITVKVEAAITRELAKEHTGRFMADLSHVKAVREFVHRLCQQAPGDSERLSESLQLAINEAFCNIVTHGYPKGNRGEVVLRGELTDQGVAFELSDQGRMFDPATVADPSFVGDREHGFGWYMIREAADRITYVHKESEHGWNHLRIFKRYIMEEALMDISHHTQDDILVVTIEAEHLDAKAAPSFKQKILELLVNENVDKVVFDLHRLQFIDSSGLGAFLSILKALNSKGGELKLSSMTKTVRTVFELVCMHKIFEIYNTPEDALRSFK